MTTALPIRDLFHRRAKFGPIRALVSLVEFSIPTYFYTMLWLQASSLFPQEQITWITVSIVQLLWLAPTLLVTFRTGAPQCIKYTMCFWLLIPPALWPFVQVGARTLYPTLRNG